MSVLASKEKTATADSRRSECNDVSQEINLKLFAINFSAVDMVIVSKRRLDEHMWYLLELKMRTVNPLFVESIVTID